MQVEPTAERAPIVWRQATVVETIDENARARTLVLDIPGWTGHLAGQHVDVRLTAEDGYVAERSYSIGSAPGDPLSLTIERLDDGEVSPYLSEELHAGDALELRGPIGGFFTWRVQDGGPLLLIGGGSGVVPLMSMLRHHRAEGSALDARLLYSARSADDLFFRSELDALSVARVAYTLTRVRPDGWTGLARRVDAEMLEEFAPPPAEHPHVFVCGPTPFVEAVADHLVDLGHDPRSIRAERFGPTGG
ncbi:MAG TPA: ferredoxin reductase [Gaiellales bacterium]